MRWIIKKARESQKNIYFCFINYAKAFDCVHHNKLWEILQEMGIPDHLTCLLSNLYAGQEATARTGHGTKWINFSNIMGARQPEMKAIIPFIKISKIDKTNVNRELSDVQAGFRKGGGTRDQIANIHWIIEKAREFQKNIYFCFIDYAKAFDCVGHNKLWKF